MDNHGNSMANTCARASSSGGAVFIRYKTNPLCSGVLVIHSNRTDRSWLSGPRWIIQVSDLSAFDGRVLAYRGSDG